MRYKNVITGPLFTALLLFLGSDKIGAQPFSGVDDLGRILPQQAEVGPAKGGTKQVGIFYFLWQGDEGSKTSEKQWDLTKLYQDHPEVFLDFHHPNWGGGAAGVGKYYFWGEPIYGYYRGDDHWVHLKNMQLLTDAAVDFLVLDATNRLIYTKQVSVLLEAIRHVRKQGKAAPKLVFYTNTSSKHAMQDIYNTFYAADAKVPIGDNAYNLEGKPLIIGLSQEAKGSNYAEFFTFRESQWPNEPQKVDGWPWIEFQRPQKVYNNHEGKREIINVSASQHPNLDASMGGSAFYGKSGNWGRSFRKGDAGNPDKDLPYGYNIQEQWDYALTQDVPFIFITGWNEWIAGKWSRTDEHKNQAHFVDQANAEYSRDIEPSWTAGLKDSYYMQMMSNIRRYKGINAVASLQKQKAIMHPSDWNKAVALYEDYTGDVLHRNHPGAQSDPQITYANNSGRNDLKTIKLIADPHALHFYVSTADKLSEKVGENWMTLWLNTDQSYASGWYGYDFRVIAGNRLQQFKQGFWQDLKLVTYKAQNNELVVRIPYENLNMGAGSSNIEFKWSDNMLKADPLDWYLNGDAAPGGRLNLTVSIID